MQKRKPKTPIQQYCTMSTERAILLGMALMAQKSNTPISEVIAQYQQVGGDLHEKSAYRALNEDLRKFYQVKDMENAWYDKVVSLFRFVLFMIDLRLKKVDPVVQQGEKFLCCTIFQIAG